MTSAVGLVGLVLFCLGLLALILVPAWSSMQDRSGAVDVQARRLEDGVRVRLERFPLTRGLIVHSVSVSRELADAMELSVPQEMRVALDPRWLSAEGDLRVAEEPVQLFFPARRDLTRPMGGHVRVTSSYRPGLRRIRHVTQVAIRS